MSELLERFGQTPPSRQEFESILEELSASNIVEFAQEWYSYIYALDKRRGHKVVAPSALQRGPFKLLLRTQPERAMGALLKSYSCVDQLINEGVVRSGTPINEQRRSSFPVRESAPPTDSAMSELDGLLGSVRNPRVKVRLREVAKQLISENRSNGYPVNARDSFWTALEVGVNGLSGIPALDINATARTVTVNSPELVPLRESIVSYARTKNFGSTTSEYYDILVYVLNLNPSAYKS